ncbi:MAG: hypothetical protein JWP44_5207, partial [Mucilaginibacter sp.]|nr:hypothetical protein [Mucilaginibacter sp.]
MRRSLSSPSPEEFRAGTSESWPAQQLAAFLAAVSAYPNPELATRHAIERVAEALDAEVVAVVRRGCRTLAIGFPSGEVPEAELTQIAEQRATQPTFAELPPLGRCAVAREPLDPERLEWLLVARRAGRLDGAERDLLRGMARVLGLTREMQGRRRLLERVSTIQRQLVHRGSPDEVLQAIIA